MRPVAKRKAPLVAWRTASPTPLSGSIAVDDDARLLTERQHGLVAENDLEAAFRAGAQFAPHVDGRSDDCGGSVVAGNDLRLVLDLVDDADLGRIIGSIGHKRQGNNEKKGKFAQTDMRSGHQALR